MDMPKSSDSIELWSKWINESTTSEQRAARKQIAFPYLYGNQRTLGDLLRNE